MKKHRVVTFEKFPNNDNIFMMGVEDGRIIFSKEIKEDDETIAEKVISFLKGNEDGKSKSN